MNLFTDYQKKIFKSLKNLEKRKIISIPSKLKSFAVELPPKNQKADMSCNAAMILAKNNNISPLKLAEILKTHLLNDFKEFNNIEVANPGFLNIYFDISFWKKYLYQVIESNFKFGSTKNKKKSIVLNSYLPTQPVHCT